jgi:RNA polymerase sigma-70 factor (ECF subfamily)
MRKSDTPPSLSDLLRHAGWTRHLARGLVGSDAAADDVVQETWIAALRRPPDTREPVRPWLATVVRRNAFNRRREETRRGARETQAEAREAPEPVESLLGRLELHKALVEAVSDLPEPYRQTVLLAYFEGLSSAEIGERSHLPASTVRGRLKTALELLRDALDGRLGSRAAWLAPVADLASPRGATAPRLRTGGAPRGGVSVAAGGGGVLLPAVAVVAVVTAAATTWTIARQRATPPTGDALAAAPGADDDRPPRSAAALTRSQPSALGEPRSAGALGPAAPAAPGARRTGAVNAAAFGAMIRGVVVAGGPEAARAATRVGRGGGVSGAVVRVLAGTPAPARSEATTAPLHIGRGRFLSHVQLGAAGTPLAILNDDDVPHAVRMMRETVELFRDAIPAHEGATIAVPGGLAVLRVNLDDRWGGAAFVAPIDNAFAAVTDAAGEFVLVGVPAGRYAVEVWDESLGTRVADVTVPLARAPLRFVFGSEPPPEPVTSSKSGPCRIVIRGRGPVADACASGGRAAATQLMKSLVKQAKARGEKLTCDGCHRDLDDFVLTPNAREDFDKLLALATRL